MKHLSEYINESLSTKQKEIIGSFFSTMFKGTKMTKEQIKPILNNLDKNVVLEISKFFSETESKDYIAYDPGEDMFLDYDNNKERIVSQISEYISKFKI